MPWPKDHKSRTRERIVHAASAAFRARGLSDVRVGDIMAGAGLTHGGFYAHFSSKDDLLGAALEHASGQTIELLSKTLASIPADRRLHAVVDAYLSLEHVAHPERGCPVAALGPEVARVSARRRRDLAHAVRVRLDWMRGLIPNRRHDELRDEQAVGALACMIGGLVMARLAGGKESAALLEACRGFLHRSTREVSG